eukprot:778921_1
MPLLKSCSFPDPPVIKVILFRNGNGTMGEYLLKEYPSVLQSVPTRPRRAMHPITVPSSSLLSSSSNSMANHSTTTNNSTPSAPSLPPSDPSLPIASQAHVRTLHANNVNTMHWVPSIIADPVFPLNNAMSTATTTNYYTPTILPAASHDSHPPIDSQWGNRSECDYPFCIIQYIKCALSIHIQIICQV